MEVAAEVNRWTRGESGLFAVLGKLFALKDKRPYYEALGSPFNGDRIKHEAHGDD